MKAQFSIGDIIKVRSKTGEYVAKLLEYRNEQMAVAETLAVLKHPTQGDLHQPNEVNVPLFHQRRAHAFHEKVVVNRSAMSAYTGEVPNYEQSLKQALQDKMAQLQTRQDSWAEKSYALLQELEQEYFH
ncbi:kinase-associated protein B [Pullulanibacillus camelliae]|uniref:Kinase-associated protein B n=1 Tax=Pullulanibacillus camelliae TaxID=1707096 RepID=A0A8J2YGI8_9BACL|nr:sporulation phosphorelay system protein KapB [Pullulanibacillus camelliae]GGE39429.1 kinase-associated protein B [Pullulanibacillus camelliae]